MVISFSLPVIGSVPRPWPIRAILTGPGVDKQTKLAQLEWRIRFLFHGLGARCLVSYTGWEQGGMLLRGLLSTVKEASLQINLPKGRAGQSKRIAEIRCQSLEETSPASSWPLNFLLWEIQELSWPIWFGFSVSQSGEHPDTGKYHCSLEYIDEETKTQR